jgi:transcriptional regulator with XRE-family HTH domain
MTSNLREKLQEKPYRDAFVASQIRIALSFQIRALREKRGWTQAQLAEQVGMLQPRISAMERPGGSQFSLETLLRLASAFDVAFIGRFVPFSELLEWAESFSPDTFMVSSFDDEMGAREKNHRGTSGEIPTILKDKAVGKDRPHSENLQQISILASPPCDNVIPFPSDRIRQSQCDDIGKMSHAAIGHLSR